MASLGSQQLEQLWIQAGGDPKVAPVMAALAIQQSSGDPTANNSPANNGGKEDSRGLWQINVMANTQYANQNLNDPLTNAKAAVAMYKSSGLQPWSLVPANSSDPYGQATENPIVSAWNQAGGVNGGQKAAQAALNAAPIQASLDSANTTPGASGTAPTVGSSAPLPPMAGVGNLHNFHGYDLSAIPKDELGNTEHAIQTYITHPNQSISSPTYDAAGNVTGSLESSIADRLKSDYGYGSWATKVPQLNAVLIAAVVNGWDQNTFVGAVSQTKWYQTTSENQRNWQITQSTDPAKAQNELSQARAKVLAVENQSGVQLSAAQAEKIAYKVAANSATMTGILGSAAGYTQEQLEQDVVKAANLTQQTQQGANVGSLGGIAGQLLDKFKTAAQQYLMYDPTNPGKSLISNESLMQHVQAAMQKYTGSGSFGSSNLINGATSDFTQQMQQQASQLYPSLASSIAAGTTPQAYVQPLQSFVAQTLGFGNNSSAINVLDPQWNWMIATPDPKTGVKTALTQDQILKKITDPNFTFTNPNGQPMTFDNTSTAMQTANTVVGSLSRMFGTGGQ